MPLYPVLIIQRHFITFVPKNLKDDDYVLRVSKVSLNFRIKTFYP